MRRSPLDGLFENSARLASRAALRWKDGGAWREASWSDYARDVRRVGRALIGLGVATGKCVCILGPNRPEWVQMALGAMAAGASAAGIYTTSTAEQATYIAAHAEVRVALVHDEKQLAKLRRAELPALTTCVLMIGDGDGERVLSWAQFLARGEGVDEKLLDERLAAIAPDDVASLIYTSGTTGVPKAVQITHRNLAFVAEQTQAAVGIGETDHGISYLPLSHIAEQVLTIHGPVVLGMTISFCESFELLPATLVDVKPTAFFGVPRVWEKMQAKMVEAGRQGSWLKKKIAAWARRVGLEAGRARQQGRPLPWSYGLAKRLVFDKVRARLGFDKCWYFAVGAAPIARTTLEFFLSLDIPIYEVYGMSEVTGPGAISSPKAFRIGAAGRALPATELKIAEDGEILMRGPHVFKGYMKDAAATAETIDAEGWLHSGDVGEIDADGYLRITDRKKDLFKTSGGKYIAPQVIESLLKGIGGVGQAVVIGDGRKFAVALLTLDPEALAREGRSAAQACADSATVKRLEAAVAAVNSGLAPYETIKRIKLLPTEFTVESGELTPTMKLKRKVVSQRYATEIDALYEGGSR